MFEKGNFLDLSTLFKTMKIRGSIITEKKLIFQETENAPFPLHTSVADSDVFLGLLDPDPCKNSKKNLASYCFVTSL
jgi:hypothetical protein